ncbi:hypothetical protein [Cupriavidus sp. DL-D2]|uniref:hypothetical protein n=1 Tax=Cupriavidus sp. DL-D2 TaxID=3144974 RepID=UPI0032126CCF
MMQLTPNLTNSSQAGQQQSHGTQADIDELRTLLTQQQRMDPRRQRFRNMYDTILELIAAGLSHAAIIRKLKSMELSISPVTFKSWLAEMQRERDRTVVTNQPGEDVSQVREAMRRSAA